MKKFLWALTFLVITIAVSAQGKFTDRRDGNVYATISIGGNIWMAENLRFSDNKGAFSLDNDKNNIKVYGMLYDWKAATEVCPEDWHLPSGAEYRTLSNYYEQKTSWRKIASDPNSFNIQLGGMQDYEGIFSEMDESGYYWTSTEYDTENAEYFSYLLINDMPVIDISRKADIADIHGTEKTNRYSVRCVKN